MKAIPAALLLLAALLTAEEGLPPHAVARLGSPRFHNPDGVGSGAASPDGRLVAFSSLDGGVRVWHAESGELAWASDVPAACADLVVFDAAGERLYGVRMDGAKVSSWDARTGAPLTGDPLPEARGHEGCMAAAAGRLVIANDDGTVFLYDLATRRMLWCRSFLGRDYECVALSADPARVALSDGDGALLVLGPDGREIWREPADDLLWTALAFSPDGSRLVAGIEEGGVQVLDAATGAPGAWLVGEETYLLSIAVSPDGSRVVAASEEGLVQAWNIADGGRTWSLRYIPDPIFVLAFSPDGGTLIVASEIGAVRCLDPVTGKDRTPGDGHLDPVVALAFSPDGKELLSGSVGGGVIVWDLATASPRWRKADGRYGVLSVAWGADGAAVWMTDGASVHRVGEAPGRHSWRRLGDLERLRCASLAPDGSTVAALPYGDAGGLWETATGTRRRSIQSAQREAASIALSPDGRAAVVAGPSVLELHAVQGTGPVKRIEPPIAGQGALRVSFSRDGRHFATASPRGVSVLVYEVALGDPPVANLLPIGTVTSLGFGGDGRTLAVGCADGRVELWDVPTGRLLQRLEGHDGTVTALAVSGDGRLLASGSADKSIFVWDLAEIPRAGDSAFDPDCWWARLATTPDAFATSWFLVGAGDEAVRLIGERLPPAAQEESGVAALIRQLDADEFEEREAASAALEAMAPDARPALEEASRTSPSAEVRSRADRLLASTGELTISSPEALRAVRAVAVLEHIGTPAAREALRRLAKGAPQSRLTREAEAALARLGR